MLKKTERERIIFLNIGWMKKYQGIHADKITGGGSFVKDKGYGHEIFNFLPFKRTMYGYVQAKGSINIKRIGADSSEDSISNVLSVWVSKAPSGGVYIVGWYSNSTVYRRFQPAPEASNRKYKGEEFGYFVKAKEEDCEFLPIDKRVLKVPRGKNGMGQANVWYADQPNNKDFVNKVLDFIKKGQLPERVQQSKNGKHFQPDPYKRQKIEREAIKIVTAHYNKLGYEITSFEKDNVGWDLEAVQNDNKLRLEVKGLSQGVISIEVTPNEYDNMKKFKDTYRVCVVTNALASKPQLSIFSYSPENKSWEDDTGRQLDISEVISARMKAK